MHSENCNTSDQPVIVTDGTVILSGYSISAKTEKDFLCLHYGSAEDQHTSRFSRATCKIKRLVILGHDGYITFSALKWLYDIGAGVIQIGLDGEIIIASSPAREHIAIKRAQYAAANNGNGLELACYLMTEKLLGQCDVLSRYMPEEACVYQGSTINAARLVGEQVLELKKASNIHDITMIEALASSVYRNAISETCLHFEKKDSKYLPEHWLTFGTRHSLINPKENRNATNPANAMLNYLYAILHAETIITLLGAGFDPYAGIVHRDNVYRASLAYDMMETVRPKVDAWLLEFVSSYIFSRRDFYHKPDGGLRVSIPLARSLASTSPLWRAALVDPTRRLVKIIGAIHRPH